MKNLLLLLLLFPLISIGQVQEKNKKIKLSLKQDNHLVHFKSHDYILSFSYKAMVSMSNDLNLSYDFNKTDTLDLKLFIIKMDSLGKGNWTNNFRLNKKFRQLIDKGKVKLYALSSSKEIFFLTKEISDQPAAGRIYSYKYGEKIVLEFHEAFIGCPSF